VGCCGLLRAPRVVATAAAARVAGACKAIARVVTRSTLRAARRSTRSVPGGLLCSVVVKSQRGGDCQEEGGERERLDVSGSEPCAAHRRRILRGERTDVAVRYAMIVDDATAHKRSTPVVKVQHECGRAGGRTVRCWKRNSEGASLGREVELHISAASKALPGWREDDLLLPAASTPDALCPGGH
jgi:hypothetical protein